MCIDIGYVSRLEVVIYAFKARARAILRMGKTNYTH